MKQLRKDFQRFMASGAYRTPPGRSVSALENARTLAEWRIAESAGFVRLVAEPETDSLESVFGEEVYNREREYIEQNGVWWVASEVNNDPDDCAGGDWESADSVGMCVYSNPLDPFENCYVVDLMRSALKRISQCGCAD